MYLLFFRPKVCSVEDFWQTWGVKVATFGVHGQLWIRTRELGR